MDEYYTIPDNPEYNAQIRKLQNTDPANAETVFNPIIAQMIENTHAIKTTMDAVGPQIVVFAASGKTVTCTDGETQLSATATSSQRVSFALPHYGVWKVQTTDDNGEEISASLVVDSAKTSSVYLSGARVIGVEWDYSNPSTALTRLTPATDPNGYVTEEITAEPTPAVGTGEGSSPFDAYSPWAGMEEYNIVTGADGTTQFIKQGAEGFSRTNNDTMVYIPPFYYAVQDAPSGSRRRFYVSDAPKDGFSLHPGSGRYIGKYAAADISTETVTAYASRSGLTPVVDITRAEARQASTAKGDKWFQLDFATYCAVVLLYVVEYADWDSQSMIGSGIVGNVLTSAQNAGLTDSMIYHTGRAAGDDENACQVQYRHIEGVWGNVSPFVDGINFNDRAAYVCTDPTKYADDTETNYTAIGIAASTSGWIKGLGFSETTPWAIVPDESGGSEITFIPDRVNSLTGWRVLRVGGSYSASAAYCGLLCFSCNVDSSNSFSYLGARLLRLP